MIMAVKFLTAEWGSRMGGVTNGEGLEMSAQKNYSPAMARPLRIEFAGAVYHLTSRGNARCRWAGVSAAIGP